MSFSPSRASSGRSWTLSSVATLSAAQAPRSPIGSGLPVVLSLAVWCSISPLSSAPKQKT